MLNKMLKSSLMLTIYAIIGTGLVAGTYILTKQKIIDNEKKVLLESIGLIIDQSEYNNDISVDFFKTKNDSELGTSEDVIIYRARKDGDNVAAIIKTEAPDGYSGSIKLLIGIYADNSIAGVRVITHNETPGLGDKIEIKKTNWIKDFDGKNLSNPTPEKWAVKKDGGVFDQFSGATITPRAVVNATKRTLIFFNNHSDEIFSTPADKPNNQGDK